MVTLQDTDPFPPLIAEFVSWLTVNHKKVCLTGSTPLVKHIHDVVSAKGIANVCSRMAHVYKHARNTDIDIYLHDDEFIAGANILPTRFLANDIESLLKRSLEDTGIVIVYDMISCQKHDNDDDVDILHVPEMQFYEGWYNRHFMGISSMYNIKIGRGSDHPPNKIQLIFTDRILPNDMTWNECVTSTFDIDICKGTIDVSNDFTNPVVHFPASALSNIEKGMFDYVIRPCLTFKHHKTRLTKYLHKGFSMKSLKFHPLCSAVYKDYVMQCFQYHYGHIYATDIFTKAGLDPTTATELTRCNVVPMLYQSKMQQLKQYQATLSHDIIYMVTKGVGMIHRRYTPSIQNCHIFIRTSIEISAMKIIIQWLRRSIRNHNIKIIIQWLHSRKIRKQNMLQS
jgi:hypothetical protein